MVQVLSGNNALGGGAGTEACPTDWINERYGPQGDVKVSEGKEITGAD